MTEKSIFRPSRQGFYSVQLAADTWKVAEWREYDKATGKAWYIHEGDTPTCVKTPRRLTGVLAFKAASQDEVRKALERELTTEEKMQAAYQSKLRTRDNTLLDCPPPSRQVRVGEEVLAGGLINCKVEGLYDEGRFVVLSHLSRSSRDNKDAPLVREFTCMAWTEVIKKRDAWAQPLAREPAMFGGYSNADVSSLMFMYSNGLNHNAEYQRGYAWTEADQQRYLESAFQGRELGRFIFVRKGYPQLDEVLDGKQRLNCLWQFYTSRIGYQGVFWHELHPADRLKFSNRSVQWATLPGNRYSRADLLRIFLEVNATGVPQSEEHLDKVRALLAEEETRSPSAA